MKKLNNFKSALLGTAILSMSTSVFAKAMDGKDAFYSFYETVDGWAGGPLGVGLATTMLIMGGGIGVAKNSPMPALSGIAGAAFLHWGPGIIKDLIMNGGLI
jgi:conjugal transfer pilus assembly protein TraA